MTDLPTLKFAFCFVGPISFQENALPPVSQVLRALNLVDVAPNVDGFGHRSLILSGSSAAFGQVICAWKATILNSGIRAGASDDLETQGPREMLYVYYPKDLSAMPFILLPTSQLVAVPCQISQLLFFNPALYVDYTSQR